MPAILIICNDDPFRGKIRHAVASAGSAVTSVPNTREILMQRPPGLRL